MKRQILIGSLILLSLSALASADELPYKEGTLLVRFTSPTIDIQIKNSIVNSVLSSSGSPVVGEYSIVPGLTRIKLPSGVTVEQASVLLGQSTEILYAEPDYKYEFYGVPGDTRFSELWGMHNTGQAGGTADSDIDAPEAWDLHTGSSSIVVAVADTGVDYTHPDLAGNMWINPGEIPGNGIDDDGSGYADDIYGCDTGDNDGNPMDDSNDAGHGTHISGTIGAVGNNGTGVVGVCWDVSIMAVKIADANGDLYLSNAIEGIQYAIDKGADVINASWGSYSYSQNLYDAVAAARNAGVIFVASAGNEAVNSDSMPSYPACYNLDNIISVLATSNTDSKASYSNYGFTSVDIGAPGGDQQYGGDPRGILSTLPDNQYGFYQGTSMAAPHVSGACALLLSADSGLSYSDVKHFLLDYSDPIPSLAALCVSGGRLNIYNSLNELIYDSTPPSDPEWYIKPQATGYHTIAMQAEVATDYSGVQYYFECVDDANFDSGWQDETRYERGDFAADTTYTFRFRCQDKSASQNKTSWSDYESTTTSVSGTDDLPPCPSPSLWKTKPTVIKIQPPVRVRMSAEIATDESGTVEYYFTCEDVDGGGPDPNFDSPTWQTSNIYTISSGLSIGSTYTFSVKTRDSVLPTPNETVESSLSSVGISVSGGGTLTVPSPYPTIQSAIDASSDGDIVVVRPGTYMNDGNRDLSFGGKDITVRSVDPSDPDVVAQTIIDVQEAQDYRDGWPIEYGLYNNLIPFGRCWSRRAFIFDNTDSVVAGFTIKNALVNLADSNGFFLPPNATQPNDGDDVHPNDRLAVGGAMYIYNGSPTIRNCVFEGCIALGKRGGDGAKGKAGSADPNDNPVAGGRGGNGGDGRGGAIACRYLSSPTISNCTIRDCWAVGGEGGDGGDGETTRGGDGGNGANGRGGGIWVEGGSGAVITDCTIIDCLSIPGQGGDFGEGTPPGNPGVPGNDGDGGGAYAEKRYTGAVGYSGTISNTTINGNLTWRDGAGIYFDEYSQATMTGCDISGNYAAYNIIYGYDGGGDGGGVWIHDNDTMLRFSDCTVSDNIILGNGDGGGIYAGNTNQHTLATIIIDSNSAITGNWAGYAGGGLGATNTKIEISDSIFSDNSAVEGAGIWVYESYDGNVPVTEVNNCVVTGNSAEENGGGFSFINGVARIKNSVFTDNSTGGLEGTGGGLFFEGWSDLPHEVTNCLITNNIAVVDGGGVSNNSGAWVQLTNCTLADNQAVAFDSAGGGLSCAEYWAYTELFNSILWDNKAVDGAQIAVGDPHGSIIYGDGPYAAVDISYSDVQGGEAGIWLEREETTAWWLDGNIDEDPLFADTDITEQTYFLSQQDAGQLQDSPCVDAGDGLASGLESDVNMPLTTKTDYAADSGTVDMGYHYPAGLDVPQYQLTVLVHDDGYGTFGTVDSPWEPGVYDVNQGRVVALNAVPDSNWVVYQWTGTDFVPVHPSDPNYNEVTMNSDKTVKVEFGPHNAYKLVTRIVGSGLGTITPPIPPSTGGLTIHSPGTVVPLKAVPNNLSKVIVWDGTDDDFSDSQNNTVTMNGHKVVEVEFYTPVTLYVPSDYTSIQDALSNSHDRDIIEIAPGVYDIKHNQVIPELEDPGIPPEYEFLFIDKDVTLRSTDPEDPSVVAETVMEGGKIVFANVGRNTTINGLTIRDTYYWGYRASEPGDVISRIDAEGSGADGYPGGSTYGGGMDLQFFGGPSSPTIMNCVFLNTSVHGIHGGNAVGGTDVDDANFSGNGGPGGKGLGGGIYIGPFCDPILINCSFIGCSATGGDGGAGGSVGLTDFLPGHGGGWGDPNWEGWEYGPFENFWRYSGYGGAVYCDMYSSPEFVNCNFVDNRVYGGSCGISGTIGQYQVEGWPYEHYRIDRFGGAVYAANGSTAKFTGCTFVGNQADPNGPATHRTGDSEPVSVDEFLGYGGAIAFENGAVVSFDNCTFNENFAPVGGATWSTWADPVVIDCNFTGNSAYHGGALIFTGGTARISGSTFTQNAAVGSAGQGGAICSSGANSKIIDCSIIDNDANGSGGGIYISSQDIEGDIIDGNNTVLIKNCLIAGNVAVASGGGISVNWNSDPNIVNCTIADNSVTNPTGRGGGLYCSYGNYTNLINAILWGNSAEDGPQLAVGTASLPSTVKVSYSDFQGGQTDVFVAGNCTLIWDVNTINPDYPTNIIDNPLFVTGPLGDYYLSQIASGDAADSDCVDTGSALAEDLGLDTYTTRTDERPDKSIVDRGYHYPFTPDAQPCRFAELIRDGIINMEDLAVIEDSDSWLSGGCSEANDWCNHADITFDTFVDWLDIDLSTACQGVEDTYPPVPNPSEWQIEPYSSPAVHPNSISMAAVPSTDAWDFWEGHVQYYFDCVFGDCNDSGWQSEPNYTDPNLVPGVEYGYRVRARDASNEIFPADGTGEYGNKTEWSTIRYAIVGVEPQPEEDHVPPTPNPMTWAVVPTATSATSISMTATTATDTCSPPVEYYFERTTGGVNSGWQSGTSWEDTTCLPETEYTYRVKARDASAWLNETGWSADGSATTPEGEEPPPPPDTNPPAPVVWEVPPYETGGGMDAYANMTAGEATDPEGNGPVMYFFQCVSVPVYNSGWTTERIWNGYPIGRSGKGLEFHFKVRDNLLNESAWSTSLPCYP